MTRIRHERSKFIALKPRRGRWPILGMLVALALLTTLGGCEEARRFFGEKLNILDEEHEIANPSKDAALATGKGCGETKADAMKSAQRVAQYNLRSLTGVRRYNIEYEVLEEYPQKRSYCVVVSAQAIPW